MESKYLEFKQLNYKGRTKKFHVISKRAGVVLGKIYWWGAWRQYIFEPEKATVWNKDCLKNIQDFLKQLMTERKLNTMSTGRLQTKEPNRSNVPKENKRIRFENYEITSSGTRKFKHSDWVNYWNGLTDKGRESLKEKARWEHMSLSAVAIEWGAIL